MKTNRPFRYFQKEGNWIETKNNDSKIGVYQENNLLKTYFLRREKIIRNQKKTCEKKNLCKTEKKKLFVKLFNL